MQPNPSYKSVAEYYSGRSVFVTGATGFLGKVLVEKLLFSCPSIDKVYLLIRDKKGDDIHKRIEYITDNVLFQRIRQICPERLQKIIPIGGDICSPGLGISREDQETIIEKVSVVIHSAATIKFNEPLKVALKINFEGTVQVLELCKRMKNIDTFIYVSTAYAHTTRKVLKEVIYPLNVDMDNVYQVAERNNLGENKKLLAGRPNIYTFSKALTENYLARNHGNIRTIIVRPSIVTPIKDEPIAGWLDNWHGSTGILYNIANGLTRITLGNNKNILDFIPVDYVSNLIVIAAAKSDRSKGLLVYNSCSSAVNSIDWMTACKYFMEDIVKTGHNYWPWPWALFSNSETIVNLLTFFLQILPAYLIDLYYMLKGEGRRFVQLQSRAIKIRETLKYFSKNTWIFECDQALALYHKLSPTDKDIYPCNPKDICWREYVFQYSQGVKKFLLKN